MPAPATAAFEQAMASASAELKAMKDPAPHQRPQMLSTATPVNGTLNSEEAAVAILQKQVTNVRRVVTENSQKDHQIGVLRSRMLVVLCFMYAHV